MFASKPVIKIGLDIGSHSIKMVKLSVEKEGYLLAGVGSVKVKNSTEKSTIEAIKDLARQLKLTTKNVAISVSGSQVIVRFITIPKMKESDIRGALQFEAEKYIPFNVKDVVIEYQVLKTREQGRKLDLVLACAKKDFIMKRIQTVEAADLIVDIVDIDTFSLANAFLKNNPSAGSTGAAMLVNMGFATTNVGIVDEGILCFARDIQFGGKIIDEQLAKLLGVDASTAEDLKGNPRTLSSEIATHMPVVLGNLFSEIKMSFGYFENQYGKTVNEVFVSGGMSGIAGIEKLFEEYIGTKAALWDPMKFLRIEERAVESSRLMPLKPSLAVSVGLALR